MFRFRENIASPQLSPPDLLLELYIAYQPTAEIAPDAELGFLSDRIGTRKELSNRGIYYASPDNYQQILDSVYGPFTITAWLINYINHLWFKVLDLPVYNDAQTVLQVVTGYGDGSFITGHPAAVLCLQLLLKSMQNPVPVRSIVGIGNFDWKLQSLAWGTANIPYIDFSPEFVQRLSNIHSGRIVGLTSSLDLVDNALTSAQIISDGLPIRDLWWNSIATSQEIPAIDRVDGHIEPTITCVVVDDAEHEVAWQVSAAAQRLTGKYQICFDGYKNWHWITIFAQDQTLALRSNLVEVINQALRSGNRGLVGLSSGYSVVPELDGFQLSSFDPVASMRMESQIQAMRSERPQNAKGELYICEEL